MVVEQKILGIYNFSFSPLIIQIVKQHIRNYLDDIFELIKVGLIYTVIVRANVSDRVYAYNLFPILMNAQGERGKCLTSDTSFKA